MKCNALLAASICLLVAGCSNSTDRVTDDGSANLLAAEDGNGQSEQGSVAAGNDAPDSGSLDGGDSSSQAESSLTPVAIQTGTVALSPLNTKIQFVGKHTNQRPDRRPTT